jgi:hypothetical protein
MPRCSERERLTVEYHEAIVTFSERSKLLRERIDFDKFAEQYDATEQARKRAENARTALNYHRTEHRC